MPTATATPATLSEQELEAQKELDQAFCSAMSRKDLDGVMRLFDTFPVVRLGIDEVSHVPVGDGVEAVGTATYDLQAKDSSAVRIVERWTDLRRQINGRWVYVLDHAHELPKLN